MSSRFATFSSLFRRKKKAKGISVPSGPQHVRVLTWNVQGSLRKHLEARLEAVCEIIKREQPHIVMLQDVTPRALELIKSGCQDYQAVSGRGKSFTAMLFLSGVSSVEKTLSSNFYNTKTEKSHMAVKCRVKEVEMWAMTCHMESNPALTSERKMQLKVAFQKMGDVDEDKTVVCAGDICAMDHELQEVGGVPGGILDIWEMLGRQQETYATYDSSVNDNSKGTGPQGQGRFDRVFLRNRARLPELKPVLLELVGRDRLPCNYFPSDHWGVLVYFEIQQPPAPAATT